MMVIMIHMSCDNCFTEVDSDEWTREGARQTAKDNGFRVRGNEAICEECWDSGVRFR